MPIMEKKPRATRSDKGVARKPKPRTAEQRLAELGKRPPKIKRPTGRPARRKAGAAKVTKRPERRTANALISSAFIGLEDGYLTLFLGLVYSGGGTQSFGGMRLDIDAGRRDKGCAAVIIRQILETVGVEAWGLLQGQYCRASFDKDRVYQIANIIDDTRVLTVNEVLAQTGNRDEAERWASA
ncbi:MAG TPA: hypothetical protein VMX15_04405 [Candidatus Heimdallarchaeota archaeon]|nr:hypothetical protein [Candidatus Heimdallarchaeota archaeon]